jgi:hypothetical protein
MGKGRQFHDILGWSFDKILEVWPFSSNSLSIDVKYLITDNTTSQDYNVPPKR